MIAKPVAAVAVVVADAAVVGHDEQLQASLLAKTLVADAVSAAEQAAKMPVQMQLTVAQVPETSVAADQTKRQMLQTVASAAAAPAAAFSKQQGKTLAAGCAAAAEKTAVAETPAAAAADADVADVAAASGQQEKMSVANYSVAGLVDQTKQKTPEAAAPVAQAEDDWHFQSPASQVG